MNIGGDLLGGISRGIVGLFEGTLRAVGAAFGGVIHVLGSALPGPWLLVVAVVVIALVIWSVFKR